MARDDAPGGARCGIDRSNASVGDVDESQQRHKRFATLQARAALAGFELDVLWLGSTRAIFTIKRPSWMRQFTLLDEVQAFLAAQGAE
jgi:hypothetical protein